MKVLLVYPPFCTPVTPPYSIVYLAAFLRANSDIELNILDLNLVFHNSKFLEYGNYYRNFKDLSDYDKVTKEFDEISRKTYSRNNSLVVDGKDPELFDDLINEIKKQNPDFVAFSVVYSSQVFYAYSLSKELKKLGIKVIVGGPAVNSKLECSAEFLKNEVELLERLKGTKVNHDDLNFDFILDYDVFDLDKYFTIKPVLPLKTTNGCYYAKCSFCTHHQGSKYYEYPLENIERTVKGSKEKYFFIVDDMIHKKRLLDLARIMKKHDKIWTCQLRPTKEYDYDTLLILKQSGLDMVMWGVESGNDRVLGLIDKGTNVRDVSVVLSNSKKAGITNIAYIIFGFPSETEKEFIETIDFLKQNSDSIDLVSTSIFGLHKEALMCKDLSKYGIAKVFEEERTILDPKITYEVKVGLSNKQASNLRDKYKKTLDKLNKFPKLMNFFREHMLVILGLKKRSI